MKVIPAVDKQTAEVALEADLGPLDALVSGRAVTTAPAPAVGNIVVGELVGLTDGGRTPLVVYPGQSGSAAVAARSIVDLHGSHVGKQLVLAFDNSDARKPIVMGVVRSPGTWPLDERPGQVDVIADGERLTVTAKEELLLQCGEASITLTKAGKVLIQGTYVSSRSSGAHRIKGGSVHIN